MSKNATKERLFEVTGRLDITFRPKLNEAILPDSNQPRPLYQIAKEIRQDWKNVYFGAVPYLQAMMTLDSIDSNYGMDSAKSIVLYFLSNASTWRGETAKRIKSELKKMAGLKEEFMREEDEVAPENLAVSPVGGVVEDTKVLHTKEYLDQLNQVVGQIYAQLIFDGLTPIGAKENIEYMCKVAIQNLK